MPEYLPNPFLQALREANAPFALTHGRSLRYQPGVIPFAALAEPTTAAMDDLCALLTPGEEIFLTTDETESLPSCSALRHDLALPGLQMRFTGPTPGPDTTHPPVLLLTPSDVPEMFALKAIAFPGYFGPRAPELGQFFGIRDPHTGHLIAMGGERLSTFQAREISAVCTHPDHLGKGHAARLIQTILRAQAQSGKDSLLHVLTANDRAIRLYQHLGFEVSGSLTFHRVTRR